MCITTVQGHSNFSSLMTCVDDDKLQHLLYQTSNIDAASVSVDAEVALDRDLLERVKDTGSLTDSFF